MTGRTQPPFEMISHHLSADNISITLSRYGPHYYVERVGPLGSKLSDTPHEALRDAEAAFAELVARHP